MHWVVTPKQLLLEGGAIQQPSTWYVPLSRGRLARELNVGDVLPGEVGVCGPFRRGMEKVPGRDCISVCTYICMYMGPPSGGSYAEGKVMCITCIRVRAYMFWLDMYVVGN